MQNVQEFAEFLVFPTFPPPTAESPPTLILRRTQDGQLLALAFDSLDRLVTVCGEHQTWAAYRTDELRKVFSGSGVERVLINPTLSDSAPGEEEADVSVATAVLDGAPDDVGVDDGVGEGPGDGGSEGSD